MDNVVFKQSLMGFDRTQVLNYIDTLVKQLKDQEAEYTQIQQKLEEDISVLSAKCDEAGSDLTLTVNKIKELSAELETFKKDNTELKEQIDYYKNLIVTKDGELSEMKRAAFNLKTRCELLGAENEKWKRRQDKIGEAIIEAEMKAEEIVKAAEQKAEETRQSFAKQAGELSQNVVDLKGEIAKVEAQLEQSFRKLQKAMETMDTSAKTIEAQVDTYKSKIEEIDTKAPETVVTEHVKKQSGTYRVKPITQPQKKSLTDNVLETIAKIIG